MLLEREFRFGRYRLHSTQGLTRGTRELKVTPKSLAVLEALVTRSGQVVTKEELFQSVWADAVVSDAALTTCILELRRALDDDARHPRYIETVHRRGFRFLLQAESDRSRLRTDAATQSSPSTRPLVGRESAFGHLSAALTRMRGGARQIVFVTGPAGIGKTTLLDSWLDDLDDASTLVARAECLEHHGPSEAYQPVLEALMRLCLRPDGDACVAALRQYAPTWLAQLPALQTSAERSTLERRTAGALPERMLRELTDALESISRRQPLIVYLDDLHWSDDSTLDWIASFARRRDTSRVLIAATFRPGEGAGRRLAPSPRSLADDLRVRECSVEIELQPLESGQTREYMLSRFPPAEGEAPSLERIAQLIHARTEGNPLFLVNALSDLIARGVLVEHDQRWAAADIDGQNLSIPADVTRTIERQLQRLTDDDRRLLEVASAVVGACSVAAVAAGAGVPAADVESTFDALARRQAFLRSAPSIEWPDGTWSASFEFLHALYREVVGAGLTPGRRLEIHRAIGTRLEAAYGERAAEVALELSVHFEEARDFDRAVRYLQHAAETARSRSAHDLARRQFGRALELLDKLPLSAARDQREAALQIGLGNVLMQANGWGHRDVATAFARARSLAERHGPSEQMLPALWNLWISSTTRGDLREARSLADRLSELAARSESIESRLQAHHAQWSTAFALGDLIGTMRHARRGMELCAVEPRGAIALGGHDAGICARLFQARALALAGQPDSALQLGTQAIARARELDHPFTLAFTMVHVAGVHQLRGDADATCLCAADARRIAQEHEFPLMLAWASGYGGWAAVEQGHGSEGVAFLREGLATASATGSRVFKPHMLSLLAKAQLTLGLVREARATIDEALGISRETGETFDLPELHRLDGESRLGDEDDAEARRAAGMAFEHAWRMANEQGAAQLALRAAVSLFKLARRLGAATEPARRLRDARAGVLEGARLPDVVEADRLLAGG